MTSQPFYFRQDDKPLFGCYHAPLGSNRRAVGVVLCQPEGHEYIRCHRAFLVLADRLSERGFPVMRFDYFASGDSAGEDGEGDLEQWMADVTAAVEEYRARSGGEPVVMVGLRLGATLSVLAATKAMAPEALVLWDPVVSGRRYLKGLNTLHRGQLLPGGRPQSGVPLGSAELLGVTYSPTLLRQLEMVDLRQATVPVSTRCFVVETRRSAEEAGTGQELTVGNHRTERAVVIGPKIWLEDADQALVPRAVLDAIVGWLSRVYP